MPASTSGQFAAIERKISEVLGRWARARNSSVSCSDRLIMKMNGTIRHPTTNGMRQPQAEIAAGGSRFTSAKPSRAATMTATCWLADCQLT